jgi:hypothetical protein
VPKRAILIQEQTPTRNVDSKTCAPRFDYCEPKARRRVLQHNQGHCGHEFLRQGRDGPKAGILMIQGKRQ